MNKTRLASAIQANLTIPCDLDTEIAGLWTEDAAMMNEALSGYITDTILDLFDELYEWLERRKIRGWRGLIQQMDQLANWNYSPRANLFVSIEEHRAHITALRDFLQQIVQLLSK